MSSGIPVGSIGPMTGSVNSSVGVGAVVGAAGGSVSVGNGLGITVGAGVSAGPDGRATMIRLKTMLAAIRKLINHSTFWLVVVFFRFDLLNRHNLPTYYPRLYHKTVQVTHKAR